MSKTYISAAYCSKCNKYYNGTYDPTITGYRDPDPCVDCGGVSKHKLVIKGSVQDPDVRKEIVNICYGENPRYSATLGVSETQIEEAMKLHPGTDFKRFGHSFRPLIRNRAHKLEVMKQAGYEEFDTKQFKGRQ